MMGQPITSVTQHKYLGVELESKLTWNEHISAITGRANSSLGVLTGNLHNCPEQIKTQAYYSLVRPHLEYAYSVWDPHTQKNIQSIEKVQRRAARFIKKCYQRTPGTIASLLEELKWSSLEQRRKQTRWTNLYKILNGTLAVVIPNYFRQKERQTRNYHPLKFINAACRTNIYKYSFFPRSVKEWNELPETIIEAANKEAFKLALRAQARPNWAFEHFLFLYHQHKFPALSFSAHSTSTAHSCWRAVLLFADQTFTFRFRFWYRTPSLRLRKLRFTALTRTIAMTLVTIILTPIPA